MRVKITFSISTPKTISLNYNILLTGIIYNFLNKSDKNFSDFLHNRGYFHNNKIFKLFVFSDLKFYSLGLINDKIKINVGNIYWYISSPIDYFVKHLVQGLFIQGNEMILDNQKFVIDKVEVLANPVFSFKEKFRMLSPLTLSTKKEIEGKLKQYYYRYDDDISEAILKNLKHKYFIVKGKESNCEKLKLTFDKNYIENQLRLNKKISKLKHFQCWNDNKKRYEDIQVKAILSPFEIETDPELIEIGYECGFGEKNSTGFGMVESV